MKVRLIAFYLPQFHPIPENDRWWGKGFTEWTNVKRARPLFKGHYQPRRPGGLGYYNLLDSGIRKKQAQLARRYGIEGFAYWHYWFGGGKRLLEKPFQKVLKSGTPDFPFCLAWANDTWTGKWRDSPDKVLIRQTYPGRKDEERHFYAVLDAFRDRRYLTVNGLPLFLIYKPKQIPDPVRFTQRWRNWARKEGLKGIYFVAIAQGRPDWDPQKMGYDATVIINLGKIIERGKTKTGKSKRLQRLMGILTRVYGYKNAVKHLIEDLPKNHYPTVIPNWDNTPRLGLGGMVLHDSRPEFFKKHVEQTRDQIIHRPFQERMIFIKSWNEWAEGNYLEPDQKFGLSYLRVLKEAVG